MKFLYLAFALLAFLGCPKAHAQWGQCDPLDLGWYDTYDVANITTVEGICNAPHKPEAINNCSQLGTQFVSYSDLAVLNDGTVQAFASSQDLSQYSATAAVQTSSTVTMPNGSQTKMGNSGQHGYAMAHAQLSFDTSETDILGTIASSHELNWPGCDGYGEIVLSSLQFKVASTKSETNYSDPHTNTPSGGGSVYCAVSAYCTPQSSPPACNPTFVTQAPVMVGGSATCQPYYISTWIAERPDSSYPWNCFPIPLPGENAFSTLDPSLAKCSKQ